MSETVQFRGEFTKITLGKQTKIEIILPDDVKFEKIAEVARFRGTKTLNIMFGNPQMAFNFDESAMQQSRQGVGYSVSPNGTVENVTGPENGEQAEMFGKDGEDAPFDQEGEEGSDDIGFEDGDTDSESEDSDESEENPEDTGEQPSKEEIEEFILSEQPAYLDIPYNFPQLLQQKKDGKTWLEIAKELGEPSTKLQAAWSKYKKEVAKQMRNGAA